MQSGADIEFDDFKQIPPIKIKPDLSIFKFNYLPPIKVDTKLDIKPYLNVPLVLPESVDPFPIKNILNFSAAPVIKAKEVISEIKADPLTRPKEVIQELVDAKNPNTPADDIKHHLRLEAGPQNKSEDTKQLEEVVIAVLNDPKAKFTYDRNLKEVFVELKEEAPINLSLLIKKANLSHVRFTEEQINQYLNQMQLQDDFDFDLLPEPFHSMPKGLLAALRFYTTDYAYNEFSYGIFKNSFKADPATLKAHLLTVCMAGHAISILPTIYSEKVTELLKQIKEKAVLSADEYVVFKNDLHHGLKDIIAKVNTALEKVLPDEELQIFKNYLNLEAKDSVSSPEISLIFSYIAKKAQLSEEELQVFEIYVGNRSKWEEFINQIRSKVDAILTVAEKEFLEIFKIPKCLSRYELDSSWLRYSAPTLLRRVGFLSTSLKTHAEIRFCDKVTWMPPIILLSRYPGEAELLLPPGEQFVQSNNVVKLVNTPILHRMSFNVGLAIRYAFLHHFVEPYKGDTQQYVCGQAPVPRSNHGLAHTMRKVFYVDSILNYLAEHALHKNVRATVSALIKNPDIVDYLKLALVFAVTGRESEVSFKADPESYLADRAQSIKNFEAYAQQSKMNKEATQFISGLIRDINDPVVLQKDHTKHYDSLQTHILSFAHNLDLMRCADKKRYLEGIETYSSFPFVKDSDEQQQAFNQLLAYATAAIKMTGDNLWCQYVPNEGMSNGGQSQTDNFILCSWSPRKCEDLLEQIPTPELCLPGTQPAIDAISSVSLSKIPKRPDFALKSDDILNIIAKKSEETIHYPLNPKNEFTFFQQPSSTSQPGKIHESKPF